LATAVIRIPGLRPVPVAAVGKSLLAGAAAGAVIYACRAVVPWPVGAIAATAAFVATLHLTRVDGHGGVRTLVRNMRVELAETPAHPEEATVTPLERPGPTKT